MGAAFHAGEPPEFSNADGEAAKYGSCRQLCCTTPPTSSANQDEKNYANQDLSDEALHRTMGDELVTINPQAVLPPRHQSESPNELSESCINAPNGDDADEVPDSVQPSSELKQSTTQETPAVAPQDATALSKAPQAGVETTADANKTATGGETAGTGGELPEMDKRIQVNRYEEYLPSWATPKECVELARRRWPRHVGYSNCAGPAVLWSFACLVVLWASFALFLFASTYVGSCTADGDVHTPEYFVYCFIPVILLCGWLENKAMNYTSIPRYQLLGRFKVLCCHAPYSLWLAVMQIISIFKRADFAMDTIFMSQLYMHIECNQEQTEAFFDAHGKGFDVRVGVAALILLYFPRLVFALLAATPLSCKGKNDDSFLDGVRTLYAVRAQDRGSCKLADADADLSRSEDILDSGGDLSVTVAAAPSEDAGVKESTPAGASSLYRTLLTKKANHRLALTLLAEAAGMASITLTDIKYSFAFQEHLLAQHAGMRQKEDKEHKEQIIKFCLRDLSTQLQRAILAIFLSGFFENCLQLNVQVLMLSMSYALEKEKNKRTPLWISIISSFTICTLKLEQTVKVIKFTLQKCNQIEIAARDMIAAEDDVIRRVTEAGIGSTATLIASGASTGSLEDEAHPRHGKREKAREAVVKAREEGKKIAIKIKKPFATRGYLHFVRWRLTPVLMFLTSIFIAAVVWAAVVLYNVKNCPDSMWNTEGCIDKDMVFNVTDVHELGSSTVGFLAGP